MGDEFESFEEGVEVAEKALHRWCSISLAACFRGDSAGVEYGWVHLRAAVWALEQVNARMVIFPDGTVGAGL